MTKVSQFVSENIQASLQQALVDIRRIDEDLKSLIGDYRRQNNFCLQRLFALKWYQRRHNPRVVDGVVEKRDENTNTLLIEIV